VKIYSFLKHNVPLKKKLRKDTNPVVKNQVIVPAYWTCTACSYNPRSLEKKIKEANEKIACIVPVHCDSCFYLKLKKKLILYTPSCVY
jgi:hypothetical protein